MLRDNELAVSKHGIFVGLSVRFKNLLLFTALVAPAGLAIAQTAAKPGPQPQATRPAAAQPAATQRVAAQPATPRPAAQGAPQLGAPQAVPMPAPEVAPPPPPLPPVWTLVDANQLLLSILTFPACERIGQIDTRPLAPHI